VVEDRTTPPQGGVTGRCVKWTRFRRCSNSPRPRPTISPWSSPTSRKSSTTRSSPLPPSCSRGWERVSIYSGWQGAVMRASGDDTFCSSVRFSSGGFADYPASGPDDLPRRQLDSRRAHPVDASTKPMTEPVEGSHRADSNQLHHTSFGGRSRGGGNRMISFAPIWADQLNAKVPATYRSTPRFTLRGSHPARRMAPSRVITPVTTELRSAIGDMRERASAIIPPPGA
jgi:hypothetical protein